ncbi:RNA polymerase recycling motor HelD [Cerasibacillus sp. JNUCC 74]
MSQEQKDFQSEQRRVNDVLSQIQQKEAKLAAKAINLKDSVIHLRKTFWDDVTVNLDEPDDVIETEASIKQQAELLAQKETIHGGLSRELKTLKKLEDSPYFGRVDFKEDNQGEIDKLYIGVASLKDANEENFLIYDWRAPISSLYYDYGLGQASYQTPEGKITGEISLKRQFIIRHGEIKAMFDTGLTIGDQLLQEALGTNASTKMKSIVATIQKEQNKIIRNEKSKLLLVQGAAGSGKTSAALQRIAYLMYRYRKMLKPENVMLFSPNPLFTSYINNVLPDLGEENVKQTTFLDFLQDKVGVGFSIESPFSQMEYLLTNKTSADYQIRLSSIEYKSSLMFKQLIDHYLDSLYTSGIQFKNIAFRKQVVITKEAIAEYFYSLEKHISLANRMELVAKWLIKELKQIQDGEIHKDWVREKIELLNKEAYVKAFYQSQKQGVDDEFILRKAVVAKMVAILTDRIKQYAFVNVRKTYQRLFTNWQQKDIPMPNGWKQIAEETWTDLQSNYLRWEDAAPYAYFKGKLLGDKVDRSVRYLVVDEAQDFSAFQFDYIKHLFPYTRMTLLGDSNQAIYVHMSKGNPLLSENEQDVERIVLTKSYRPTKQIVEFTMHFAPYTEAIEPFERNGNKPVLMQVEDENDITDVLIKSVRELFAEGYETIAIITKTLKESETFYQRLKDHIAISQINEETYTFMKGLLIIPVYLAKGIEFDAVLIPDASAEHYPKEDQTLFYTSCTRAMHELRLITSGQTNELIKQAPKATYNSIKV